jgi:hypothetical protein
LLPLRSFDALQIAGALASVFALLVCRPDIPFGWQLVLLMLGLAGGTAVIVSVILARRSRLSVVPRAAMIETGDRLIRGAKSEVVMFAGDCRGPKTTKNQFGRQHEVANASVSYFHRVTLTVFGETRPFSTPPGRS